MQTKTNKNTCLKQRDRHNPYEVWTSRDGTWQWHVLKKWQADDNKQYARWYCYVTSPFCDGEYGDVYVQDIKQHAVRTQ